MKEKGLWTTWALYKRDETMSTIDGMANGPSDGLEMAITVEAGFESLYRYDPIEHGLEGHDPRTSRWMLLYP